MCWHSQRRYDISRRCAICDYHPPHARLLVRWEISGIQPNILEDGQARKGLRKRLEQLNHTKMETTSASCVPRRSCGVLNNFGQKTPFLDHEGFCRKLEYVQTAAGTLLEELATNIASSPQTVERLHGLPTHQPRELEKEMAPAPESTRYTLRGPAKAHRLACCTRV